MTGLVLPKYKLRQRTFQVREGLTQSAHSVQNETGTESALSDHCGDITFLLNRKEHRYRELPTAHKSAYPSITAQGGSLKESWLRCSSDRFAANHAIRDSSVGHSPQIPIRPGRQRRIDSSRAFSTERRGVNDTKRCWNYAVSGSTKSSLFVVGVNCPPTCANLQEAINARKFWRRSNEVAAECFSARPTGSLCRCLSKIV